MDNQKTQEELLEEFKQNFINEVRQERNRRIAETDYIYMPDVNVSIAVAVSGVFFCKYLLLACDTVNDGDDPKNELS